MKIEHYKEPKTFKGFEAWWHSVQMTAKMYTTIFFMLFTVQILLSFFLLFLFERKTFILIFQSLFTLSPSLILLALKVLVKSIYVYLIITLPVYFFFPFLLLKFKLKAKNIMRDEFLRGSRLVSEDELRKLVLQDLKREYEVYKKKYNTQEVRYDSEIQA